MSVRPLLLGHRGARAVKSIPENTQASFDRALADGCDGFEFDVRLTAAGRAVVHHDAKVGAFEIGTARPNQLPALPQLEEVLKQYQERAFLDIELKVTGLEKTAIELLRRHTPGRGFVVSSFLPEVLRDLNARDSAVPLGLICEKKVQLGARSELPVEYIIAHERLVTPDLLREIRREARKLLVWTVNDRAEMLRLAEWGVDGLISDDTKLLCQTLPK